MNVVDWRGAAPDVLDPLYARGQLRWRDALGWETSANWRSIEQARTTWGLPGALAVDEGGAVRGWSYFLFQDDMMHVGGLAADTPTATDALVGALVGACEDSRARGVSCFMFDEAPALVESLERQRFVTEPYLYLTRDLAGLADSDAPPTGVPWRELDLVAAAALLRESYSAEGARHFALGHTVAAWERYVRNVVEQTGLGTFNAHATRLVRRRQAVDAIVLMTSLSAETAHLAQVAVRPERRGEGLARALVSEACAVAAQQGFRRATLLVGASNIPARRLYDRLGFTAGPRFVAAHR